MNCSPKPANKGLTFEPRGSQVRIENIAEFARADRAHLHAGRIASRAGALDTEMAFLHDTLAAWPVAQVSHIGIDFIFGDLRFGEIEAPRPIRAGGLAVAAANAPIVINDCNPVRFLPGGMDGADFDAGWILALLALDGHVEEAFFGDRLRGVVVIALFHVHRAVRHFEHADVLDFRIPGLIILLDAAVNTFSAANAARQVERINELDAVHGLEVAHVRTNPVLPLDLVFDALKHLGHLFRCQFLVVLLQEFLGGGKIFHFKQRRQTGSQRCQA